jgi:hypothetical protein
MRKWSKNCSREKKKRKKKKKNQCEKWEKKIEKNDWVMIQTDRMKQDQKKQKRKITIKFLKLHR